MDPKLYKYEDLHTDDNTNSRNNFNPYPNKDEHSYGHNECDVHEDQYTNDYTDADEYPNLYVYKHIHENANVNSDEYLDADEYFYANSDIDCDEYTDRNYNVDGYRKSDV